MPGNLELLARAIVEMIRLQLAVGKKDYSSPILFVKRLGKFYLLWRERTKLRKQDERVKAITRERIGSFNRRNIVIDRNII